MTRIDATPAGENLVERLHNLSASADPTANDDSGDGYGIGSLWLDTTNGATWQALDVTPGAALWVPLSNDAHSNTAARPLDIINSVIPSAVQGTFSLVSGQVVHAIFRAPQSKLITKMATRSRGAAAGATPTLCRTAICTVEFDGTDLPTMTKVAQIASSTSLWNGTFTEYERALDTAGGFPASYQILRGQWYSFATLIVTGAALPGLYSTNNGMPTFGLAALPSSGIRISQSGQTDIPSSFVSTARADSAATPWGAIY